jgi:hypothetical protein
LIPGPLAGSARQPGHFLERHTKITLSKEKNMQDSKLMPCRDGRGSFRGCDLPRDTA